MPLAKQKGRKYFKSGHNKQKYGRKGNKSTFRQIRPYGVKADPFPTRLHTRCKYVGSVTLTASATAFVIGAENQFRLNSIYDPWQTGTGTTVVGHANLANLYSFYQVKGVKVEVVFSNPNDDGITAYCSLNQSTGLVGQSDAIALMDSLVYSSSINNTGSQKKRMNFYVKPWSLGGLTKQEWIANKGEWSSGISGNPSSGISLRVACSAQAGGSKTIHCVVKFIYYTEFWGRKQLDASSF